MPSEASPTTRKAPFQFGTDGLRGRFGVPPFDDETLKSFADALASFFAQKAAPNRKKMLIARDTRASGPLIENILTKAFKAHDLPFGLLSILPTPALVHDIVVQNALGGVMISASHNPAHDNGIKIFKEGGAKLALADEQRILDLYTTAPHLAETASVMAQSFFEESGYEAHLRSLFAGLNLKNLHLVVDCAHGAMYQIAPRLLKSFGAKVTPLATSADGHNINQACGSTHPKALQDATKSVGADFGIAFDGDGDRVLFCKKDGTLLNGDQLLTFLALAESKLTPPCVVSTIMANQAMEETLAQHHITLVRTNVGDKAVAGAMEEKGALLGGEASGHLILKRYSQTGDGLLAALAVLRAWQQNKAPPLPCFVPYPQHIENIPLQHVRQEALTPSQMLQEQLQQCIKKGRLFLRRSGTEPVLRLTIEAPSEKTVKSALLKALSLIVR
ncbi:MAG: hypothetical protein V6Z78_04480 [Holosporaceae bacterium]